MSGSIAGVFGEMVRAHRRRLGLSQEDLADKAGINARTIGNIEAGRIQTPRAATVRLLATAFSLEGIDRERFCAAAIPAPDPLDASAAPREPGHLTPRQLPAAARHFVGRMDELDTLDVLTADGENAGAIVISAIAGAAGIGKTALALHWAHQVADRFPDGQLYVNLRGFDASEAQLSPGEALRGFLDAMDVPPRRIPNTIDGQAALFRSVVADRRMLIVLDNARDSEQVRPLLPGSRGCLVLVTSRRRLTGLVTAEAARMITLDLLSVVEAEELLALRLGGRRLGAEPQAVSEIISHCARLPLALAIVAARAAVNPGFPLARLAEELRDAHSRLDALAGEESGTDVRAVFSWSYEALSPGAARLFRLLGLHPGADCTLPAAASLAGLPRTATRALLTELTQAHLLAEPEPGRYAAHDLLRLYAADLAAYEEPEEQQRNAFRRLFDHYMHTAYHGERLLDRHREPIILSARVPGVDPEPLRDAAQATEWFAAERETLLAFFDAAPGWYAEKAQLAWCMGTFLNRSSLWSALIKTQEAAIDGSRHAGDTDQERWAHLGIARAYIGLDRLDEASEHLQQGLAIAIANGHVEAQANAYQGLGNVMARLGRNEEGIRYTQQAFHLYQNIGHQRGQAITLNNLGMLHVIMGAPGKGLDACRQALTLHEQLGTREGQAAAWDSMAGALHQLGDHQEAIACCANALAIVRELADRRHEAMILVRIGDVRETVGNVEAAVRAWREALSILEETWSDEAVAVRAKLRNLRSNTD